jgi:hypothetical protein
MRFDYAFPNVLNRLLDIVCSTSPDGGSVRRAVLVFSLIAFISHSPGLRADEPSAESKGASAAAANSTTSEASAAYDFGTETSPVSPLPDSSQPPKPQDGLFRSWFKRVAETQAAQPHWITPVVTVTPRLEQEFRYDISQQTQPNGTTILHNFGGSKGLEIIPTEHTELIFSPPPFITRSVNGVPDGYGDVSFLLKYRIFAANEERGNYILTAFLGGSVPTGSYTNGTRDATITPTIAAGKGWRNLDATTMLGAILPVSETNLIGRQVVWNTAFQYCVMRKIWPEIEVNSTFFSDGPNDGKKQTFLTPGLVLGKFPIWHRLGVTVGGGLQTAVTKFHTYNHKWILTVRFPF